MMHERERQECLKQGNRDCPREKNYQKFEKDRQDIIPSQHSN